MVIHDRSYARWDGDRSRAVRAAPVIAAAGVRKGLSVIFRRKVFAVLLTVAAFGPFVAGLLLMYIGHYVRANAGDYEQFAEFFQQPDVVDMTTASARTVYVYMIQMQPMFVFLACLLVGAGLVAEDRRANALELYLSRPVTVGQYVLGKLFAVAFFVALVTMIPALLAVLAQMSLSWSIPGELLRLLRLMGRTVAAGTVLALVPSLLVLAASSLAKKARNAAIGWVAFVLVLEGPVTNIPREIFHDDRFYLLSFGHNIARVVGWILGHGGLATTVPEWQSALVLAGWCVVCLVLIVRRVRPVEVVA